MSRSRLPSLFVASALLTSLNAAASCLLPAVFHVGSNVQQCSYTTIQSAIDNANASGCRATPIYITSENPPTNSYVSQALTISGKNVLLIGSANTDCSGNVIGSSSPTITLSGDSSGHSVIHVDGTSNVTLQNLTITGGQVSNSGGGIYFGGTGSLTLQATTVSNNHAGYGGGIDVSPSGGPATLTLNANTLIVGNTADTSGGAIRIEGDTRLFALQPQTLIEANHAPGGYGGGIEVLGPALADIGSPGYNGLAVIYDNDAEYGGGMALIGNPNVNLSVAQGRLFTTDANHPVQVSDNVASHTGGGIFVQPNVSGPAGLVNYGDATLCAFDFRMDDNIAQEGTAVYGDTDIYDLGLDAEGATVKLTSMFSEYKCNVPESVGTLGAVDCARGVACNTMDGNVAEDNGAQPTPGSTILMQNSGDLKIYGLYLQHNQGQHAIRVFDSVGVDIQDCLLTDNTFSSELMHFEGSSSVILGSVRGCTIANNAIGGTSVIDSSHDLQFYESIVDQPDNEPVTMESGATLYPGSLVSTNVQGLPSLPSIVHGTASFIDAANGDYHLTTTSLGLDFAPAGGGTDLDRLPRDVDLSSVTNVYGPRDLGAYERQNVFFECGASDSIYCDGFEH